MVSLRSSLCKVPGLSPETPAANARGISRLMLVLAGSGKNVASAPASTARAGDYSMRVHGNYAASGDAEGG